MRVFIGRFARGRELGQEQVEWVREPTPRQWRGVLLAMHWQSR